MHGSYLMPSLSLNPYLTFLSADHFIFYSLWGQNHQERTSTDAFTTSPQLPASAPICSAFPLVPNATSYLRSTLPALTLDSVPSSFPRHSPSNSAIPFLPAFSHFLSDHQHRNCSIALISLLLKTFPLISFLLLNICCLNIFKKQGID